MEKHLSEVLGLIKHNKQKYTVQIVKRYSFIAMEAKQPVYYMGDYYDIIYCKQSTGGKQR